MSTLCSNRNQSMELAKLVASFFVVFIHVPFPGDFGILVDGLGRYAVPMFFAISGYFNYQADSGKVWKRTRHLISLYVIAVVLHLLWGCIVTEAEGGSTVAYLIKAVPDPDEFTRWLIIQTDPFSGQLWYLNSAIVTYVVYWVYVRFYGETKVDYRPLYFAAFVLFAIYFGFCTVTVVGHGGEALLSSRNAWFTGIPMFTLGIFVREHQQQIFENFRLTAGKLWIMLIIGVLLVIQQWNAIGLPGMPFGTLFIIAALVLLLVSHPNVGGKSGFVQRLALKCGPWSTWIYILHLIVNSFYEHVCQPYASAVFTQREAWLHPLIVLGISFLAAIAAERIEFLIKRLLRRHS